MKPGRICRLAILALSIASASAADLKLDILPRWTGAPLEFDALALATPAGQPVSVTRLDLLLSRFALHRVDGPWVERTNCFAYVNSREGQTHVHISEWPHGRFDRLRFSVGVPAIENHADPAGLAADHPLNPNVNGLHWNWQGGYVFFALEGNWRPGGAAAGQRGYSWHIATDRLLTLIELPIDPSSNPELRLALDVDRLFSIPLSEETSSTHSRNGDEFAARLARELGKSFAVLPATPTPGPAAAVQKTVAGSEIGAPLMAPNATPYRLVLSRHFPQPALPLDNPLTEEGVELGRRLFHDVRLSMNNRQSCASCHQAGNGFTDAGNRFSSGAEGQLGTRNTMPLLNLAWKKAFFWDGRAASLREQVLMPIRNPIEMHETLSNVVAKLIVAKNAPIEAPDFQQLFARAFGTPEINPDRIARALEQFLLVQVSRDSKFDRALNGEAELNDEEKRGFELFQTEYDPRRGQFGADCFHCHGGPLFQSQSFANNGLDAAFKDKGRSTASGRAGDDGKFAVPSLRNIAATGPYMHDGRFASLEEVVEHYASGVQRSATLDPNLAKHPNGGIPLSTGDKRALVAFLRTLTDEHFSPSRDTLARSP